MKGPLLSNALFSVFFVASSSLFTIYSEDYICKIAASVRTDGLSWSNALGDIQRAIDMVQEVDSILIDAGKCIPQCDSGYIVQVEQSIIV